MGGYKQMNDVMRTYLLTEEKIVEYLKSFGYPEERISMDWGNHHCSIDIIVFDESNILPIVVFEVKATKNKNAIESGVMNLRRAVRTFEIAATATCYLAFPSEKEPYFEIHNVSRIVYSEEKPDYNSILIDTDGDKLASYNTANAGSAGKILKQRNDQKKKKIDKLRIMCFVLAMFGMAIGALDYYQLYELSSLRLILFGAIVILLLVPYFSEVSIKDISLKRVKEEKEGNKDV